MTITALTDAELLDRARGGDESAFTELYLRHQPAAQRLAASYRRLGDPDDLVNTAFERVIGAIRNGAGPTDSFRAYLFVTLRRYAAELGAAAPETSLDDVPEPIVAAADAPALDNADRTLITQAFESLPERWQAVLWHTAVEGRRPGELADSLGVSANAAAAMAYRAREKLRQAYLQAHLVAAPAPEHEPFRSQLGGYVRGGLSARDTAAVEDHLDGCASCTALLAELEDVNSSLSRAVLPLFLLVGGGKLGGALLGAGGVAAGMAAVGAEAGGAAGGAAAAGAGAGTAAGGGGAGAAAATVGVAAKVRHLAPVIGAGAAAVAAAVTIALIVASDDEPPPLPTAPADEIEVADPPDPPPTTTPPTTALPPLVGLRPIVPTPTTPTPEPTPNAPLPPPSPVVAAPAAPPPTPPPPTPPPPTTPPPTSPPPTSPPPTSPPPTTPPTTTPIEPAPGLSDTTWTPDGPRTGTLTVPVSDPNGGALTGATLVVDATGGVSLDPDRPSGGCTQADGGNAPVTCTVPNVAAGEGTVLSIHLAITGQGQKAQSLSLLAADGSEIDRLGVPIDLRTA
jgi:RNA polymerase sigma factor (sigma-70 family)